MAYLASRTTRLAKEPDPHGVVSTHWKSAKGTKSFEEIHGVLLLMASGRERCMYCEDSAGTDIEHFYPKSRYPQRAFSGDNYLLACSHCNSNRKRDRFPLTKGGQPKLIDPTSDNPRAHLRLLIDTGELAAITSMGLKSIDVFGLNRERLTRGRSDAWRTALILMREYSALRDSTAAFDQLAADEYLRTIRDASFASVRDTIGSLFTRGGLGLDRDICELVARFPELVD